MIRRLNHHAARWLTGLLLLLLGALLGYAATKQQSARRANYSTLSPSGTHE